MRLVTRGDLDGLTCAVLITAREKISEIKLIHPQDITDRAADIRDTDIIANLPYHPNCAKWFDHHLQTGNNPTPPPKFEGKYGLAPSAARLVWEYYDGAKTMPQFEELVKETDRLDSARLTPKDVTDPRDYILLGYTIDGRTGAGKAFQAYFHLLLQMLKTDPIAKIIAHPKVQERIKKLKTDEKVFKQALEQHSRLDGNVVVTDFRGFDEVPSGNRFLIYTLFPTANVSVRIHWGPRKARVIAAIGHSIFNRTCKTAIGTLVSKYGGGGHTGAGTTPLEPAKADEAILAMIAELKKNG